MAEQAPLSIAMELGDVKTAIPILANDHMALCTVEAITQSAHEKGPIITFKFKLAEPAPTYDGKEVQAGFPVSQRVCLFDKNTPAGEVPARSKEAIAKTIDAIFGTGDAGNQKNKPPRPALTPETVAEAIGKQVVLKFKAVTEGEYAGTEIKAAYFPGDLSQ